MYVYYCNVYTSYLVSRTHDTVYYKNNKCYGSLMSPSRDVIHIEIDHFGQIPRYHELYRMIPEISTAMKQYSRKFCDCPDEIKKNPYYVLLSTGLQTRS